MSHPRLFQYFILLCLRQNTPVFLKGFCWRKHSNCEGVQPPHFFVRSSINLNLAFPLLPFARFLACSYLFRCPWLCFGRLCLLSLFSPSCPVAPSLSVLPLPSLFSCHALLSPLHGMADGVRRTHFFLLAHWRPADDGHFCLSPKINENGTIHTANVKAGAGDWWNRVQRLRERGVQPVGRPDPDTSIKVV